MRLVAGVDDGLGELVRAAEVGELKGLYVCGADMLEQLASERLDPILKQLEVLIVHALRSDARLAGATVVFPTTTFAEKDGSFTNHAGRVQRIFKAIETPPGWLCEGEIFTHLLESVGKEPRRFDLDMVWESMRREIPAFAGLSLETLGTAGAMLDENRAERSGDR
jgi:NADH-quinone oxidoreductase subunit G